MPLYLYAKFDNSSFSHSRGKVVAHQNLNGSRDPTTPFLGLVCHLWASTCNDQAIYQIWSLYLHPLWRYERRYI